jgi:hypothetical protein
MVLLDQVKYELSQFEEPLLNMEEALNRDVKNKRIAEIEGKDVIGISYASLRSYISLKNKEKEQSANKEIIQPTDKGGVIFENKKCIIRKAEIISKKTNRGGNLKTDNPRKRVADQN